ncbi:MAG: hypothetical protein AAFR35_06575 [Pseudomonadota bacterium]
MTATATLFAAACSAAAEVVISRDCTDEPIEEFLADLAPGEATVKDYANGRIRVVILSDRDAATGGTHVGILHPGPGDTRLCRMLSGRADGSGWDAVNFSEKGATYDPSKGLTVPITVHSSAQAGDAPRKVDIVVNQASGEVAIALDTHGYPAEGVSRAPD